MTKQEKIDEINREISLIVDGMYDLDINHALGSISINGAIVTVEDLKNIIDLKILMEGLCQD